MNNALAVSLLLTGLSFAFWAVKVLSVFVSLVLYACMQCCYIRGNLKEYCCHKIDKR